MSPLCKDANSFRNAIDTNNRIDGANSHRPIQWAQDVPTKHQMAIEQLFRNRQAHYVPVQNEFRLLSNRECPIIRVGFHPDGR